MLTREEHISLVADLLNRAEDPRERERRVRESHRSLYRQTVTKRATDAEADLALAEAAQKEQT